MAEDLYTKKEHESILLRAFGTPQTKDNRLFLDNPLFDFTKKEVVEALGMSKQTLYKYLGDVEDLAIVKVSRRIGKAKLYKINLENPMVKLIREHETQLSLQKAEQEKAGVQGSAPQEPDSQRLYLDQVHR